MTSPRYVAVAEALQSQIGRNEFGSLGALPTEADLCSQFNVSRSTIRRALELLRERRLVVSRQGSGWTAVGPAPAVRIGTRPNTHVLGDHDTTQTVVNDGLATPPGEIAAALLRRRSRKLYLVERVTAIDDEPVHRSETWFARSVSDTVGASTLTEAPPALSLAQAGYRFGPFEQFVQAVLANDRDRELLGLPSGSPVLQVSRTAVDPEGPPLFRSLHRHPGDRTRLDIDLPTTDQIAGPRVYLEVDESSSPI